MDILSYILRLCRSIQMFVQTYLDIRTTYNVMGFIEGSVEPGKNSQQVTRPPPAKKHSATTNHSSVLHGDFPYLLSFRPNSVVVSLFSHSFVFTPSNPSCFIPQTAMYCMATTEMPGCSGLWIPQVAQPPCWR